MTHYYYRSSADSSWREISAAIYVLYREQFKLAGPSNLWVKSLYDGAQVARVESSEGKVMA